MGKTIDWRISVFADKLHEQAEKAGVKLHDAELCQEILDALMAAHINGVITDGEWNKILPRFFNKMVKPRLEEMKDNESDTH